MRGRIHRATQILSRFPVRLCHTSEFVFKRHQPDGAWDCSPVSSPLGTPQDTVLAWAVSERLLWEQSSPGKMTSSLQGQPRQWLQRKRRWGRGRWIFVNEPRLQLPKSQWDGCVRWVMGSGEGRKEEGEEGRKEEGREEGTEMVGRPCPTPKRSQALDAECAGLAGFTATPVTQVPPSSHPSHRQGGKAGVPSSLSQSPGAALPLRHPTTVPLEKEESSDVPAGKTVPRRAGNVLPQNVPPMPCSSYAGTEPYDLGAPT